MAETKMVSIPEEELQAILAVNKKLLADWEADKTGQSQKINKKVKEHKVTICFVNGKAVVGMVDQSRNGTKEFVYEMPNPRKPGEFISYVDLILDGEDEPLKKVNFTQFLNEAERIELPYSRVEEKEWSIIQGEVEASEVKDYHTERTGNIVDVEVLGKHRIFEVRLPDGRDLMITEGVVNMTK